jgi:hypothetical protein
MIGSWIRIRNKLYESKDLDPDPYQNVTDPDHWKWKRKMCFNFLI